jgi:hypothetical protein
VCGRCPPEPRDGSPAFPPPALPGFAGTMRGSDFPAPVCLPVPLRLVGHTRLPHGRTRGTRISLVAAMTACEARSGLRPRVSRQHSPITHCPVLPSIRSKISARSVSYPLSGLNPIHGRVANPVHSTSLPFCVRFNVPVASHAATLDTGRLASPYPGGIRTRLSWRPCQVAPNVPCWQRLPSNSSVASSARTIVLG